MDAIDDTLRELREARPSPDFVPRLRAYVESAPRPIAPRLWMPLSAVAAAAIVGLLMRTGRPADAPAQPPSRPVLDARTTLGPPALPPRGTPIARLPRVTRVARAVRPEVVSSPPEVLVAAGQREVMGRLLDALSSGHADAVAVVRSLSPNTDVVVAPIRIDPVVVAPLPASSLAVNEWPDLK